MTSALEPQGETQKSDNRMTEIDLLGDNAGLNEVKAHLIQYPEVQEAAVVTEDISGQDCVVAYVVPEEEPDDGSVLNAEALRMQLTEVFSADVVPRALVVLESLPRSGDGTLDRRALPVPELDLQADDLYEPPEGATEEGLAQIWQEMLQIEEIGRNSSFFDLGGHSLNAIRMLHRVKEQFGSEFRINDVYQSPTLAELSRRIEEGEVRDEAVDLRKEASLDDDIRPSASPSLLPPKTILLTGATGFVGRFLLSHLLESTDATIHCLVRALSEEDATARLRGVLANWGLWRDTFEGRVIAVPGRLGAARLGMADDAYRALSEQVDAIYHCGASVNHLETYAMAKAANVGGAKELLRLATDKRPKAIHYISTLAVFSSEGQEAPRVVNELSPIEDERHLQSNGYEASKWVAEKLFMTASERGIPCNIFRLGVIGPDALTGRYDEQQREYRMVKSCLLSGYGIDGYRHEMPLIPVNHAVQEIVHLAGANAAGNRIFHISGSGDAMDDLFEQCNRVSDLKLEQKPWFEWIEEMKRLHHEGRSLPAVPLVDFAFSMDQAAFDDHQRRLQQARTVFDCDQTRRELELAKIPDGPFDDAALRALIRHMFSSDLELRSQA